MIEYDNGGDGIAVVTLSRPPVNALDLELVGAITAGVTRAIDEDARALVLTGAGSCFCAGIDTKATVTYTPEQRADAVRAINGLVSVLYSTPIPVIAAVNGHAFGGGLVIALACDFRVAATGDYRLALNEAAAGVPFPAGPLRVVMAELDPSVVRDLCFTSRAIGPAEALGLRAIDELVDPASLHSRARERAVQLAGQPAFGAVKRQLRGPVARELTRIAETGEDPLVAP